MGRFLVTFFMVFAFTSSAFASRGGEDFPFRCDPLRRLSFTSLLIKPDTGSETGYLLTYRTRLGLRGNMQVTIKESDDGRHFVVEGSARTAARLFERHVKALIARAAGERSSVSFQLTLPGLEPVFSATLHNAYCYAN